MPALHAAREVPKAGWPWWIYLLPLLCCLIPLIWLLCRKRPRKPLEKKAEPIITPVPGKRSAPSRRAAEPVYEVKREPIVIPEKKFIIEKVIDEPDEAAIDREIED